ncbi:MAG: CinA family protein [Lachnospiraceae bacterium]|nr:CinA family protein [Lachnospiraceae bacterium]
MNMNEVVTRLLIEKHLTISFMESCTSGLLASMLTDTEGASAVFKGSFVTYSNEAKVFAGVDGEIIEKYGVYSAECARAMAETALKKFGADLAVGITGSTGNTDPNNADSVQGEAFFCILIDGKAHDYKISIDVKNMSRKEIKQFYADEVYSALGTVLLS